MRALRILGALFMVLGGTVNAAEPMEQPPCWGRQSGGTGSLYFWDVNFTGGVAMWYCPPVPPATEWSRQYFLVNWVEIPGGMAEAVKTGWRLMHKSTDADRAAMWATHLTKTTPDQDYSAIRPMAVALAAEQDPRHLPAPAPPMTVAPAVYYLVQQRGRLVPVVVGTVPLNTPCDPKQQANGLMVVPASAVVWSGAQRPLAPLASCAFASP